MREYLYGTVRRGADGFAAAFGALMVLVIVLGGLPGEASADAYTVTPQGHAYVEAFGGYAWPGNISAGGEGDERLTVTLEREGKYAVGGGAGYVFPSGVHLGGKIVYTRHGCDGGAGHCAELFEGVEIESATLGILATAGYTLRTGLIADPFIEADIGLGYVSLICEGVDACPNGRGSANYADAGLMYGVCGGLEAPLTDSRTWRLIADACWRRTEGVSVTGAPHWDAPDAVTAGLRVRRRL